MLNRLRINLHFLERSQPRLYFSMKYHLLITLALFATGCSTLDYNAVEDNPVRKTQPAAPQKSPHARRRDA